MKIFIIHSNKDNAVIEQYMQYIQERCKNAELLSLTGTQKFWKREAARKIWQADIALFFVGQESHKSKAINWELKKFKRQGKKIFTIKLEKENKYNEILYRKEHFLSTKNKRENYLISTETDIERVIDLINKGLEIDVESLLKSDSVDDKNLLIEQYKAYLQTSEDLVERRQKVSSFYITINSTMVTIFSALITVMSLIELQNLKLLFLCLSGIFFGLGIILCLNWIRILGTYGKLNSAKMTVISKLEKLLPAKIYDTEWEVQNDRIRGKRYVSFTENEQKVPKVFLLLYFAILLFGIILFLK